MTVNILSRPRPFALIILDGWGYREEKTANAIAQAHTPVWDHLWNTYPHLLISGCGRCVGLPAGQMGNSEVGHLNIGAGRVVYQDLTRIDAAIENGEFFHNEALTEAIDQAIQSQKAIHILGLVSPGGVHSHEQHIQAILKLAAQKKADKIYLHAILDGRDTPPRSALPSLKALNQQVTIASLIGRYFAMDRDQRWERIQSAYELFVEGKAQYQADNVITALEAAYQRGETDEFVKATCIHTESTSPITIKEGDTVIFMNFRADRARELTTALTSPHFNHFPRRQRPNINFVTLTEYDPAFPVSVAFLPTRLNNILGEYLSKLGLHQLRIAETEKYAHITFFFNGGIEEPYPNEDRVLIPSPKVATYDLKPEMSAIEVTDRLIQEINDNHYDFIVCNFANPDMVGHSGNLAATIKAIEVIDTCLGRIMTALKAQGGEALITADHGNAELMFDPKTQQPHTAHTMELVPLVYIGRPTEKIADSGVLSDIAPTILNLLHIPQPQEMTGHALFKIKE